MVRVDLWSNGPPGLDMPPTYWPEGVLAIVKPIPQRKKAVLAISHLKEDVRANNSSYTMALWYIVACFVSNYRKAEVGHLDAQEAKTLSFTY